MPSTRDLPLTIKVGKRGTSRSSRSRAESPLFDTRSKGTKSSRGRGRERERKKREHSDRPSKSKDRSRSGYEPPERQDQDVSGAVRHPLETEKQVHESRDDDRRRSTSRDRRRRHAYAEREREREEEKQRAKEYELEREYERERERERERNRRRERTRDDRKKKSGRSSRSSRHRDYDDAEHYRQFEEVDDDDYEYSKMQKQPVDNSADAGGDPFNLCAGSESFSDVEMPPPSRTRRARRAHKLANTSMSTADSGLEAATWSEDHYHQPRQDHSYASIAVTALQLLVLMLQLAMCGVAPLDVNPMVGPFPDAFSEWGGKNAYLMLDEKQYWRLVTPAFLHVGVLHLLANAFCLLYSSALFEREWGSWTWLFIFIVSEVGCVGVSSVADPETIAVGSSGALMGLFAAKLAHVLTYTFFETYDDSQDEGIHVDQLGSVLCGLTLVSLLSSFTYVDWSGHMGGLASGFFAGMLVFARPIKSCCGSLFWGLLGLAGLGGTATIITYLLMNEIHPDEELADTCEYFRHLFPEGYECGCLW